MSSNGAMIRAVVEVDGVVEISLPLFAMPAAGNSAESIHCNGSRIYTALASTVNTEQDLILEKR